MQWLQSQSDLVCKSLLIYNRCKLRKYEKVVNHVRSKRFMLLRYVCCRLVIAANSFLLLSSGQNCSGRAHL